MNYICELCGAELHVEEDYRNNLPKTTYKSLIIEPCSCQTSQVIGLGEQASDLEIDLFNAKDTIEVLQKALRNTLRLMELPKTPINDITKIINSALKG